VSRGFKPTDNTVTVFAGEGPRNVVDHARYAEPLANSLAACLLTVHHPKALSKFDAMLVIGPEHARVFREAAWDRRRVLSELHSRLQIPGADALQGARGMSEGLTEEFRDKIVPKFRPEGILLTQAGGGAGFFSAIMGGWAVGARGSNPVTKIVQS
jgi:hypothetical protein